MFSNILTTSSSCPSCSGFWCPPSTPWFPAFGGCSLHASGFQRFLPSPTHPPSFAPIGPHLLTRLWRFVPPLTPFSTWTSSMWVAQSRISGRICSVSVLIFTCAGISALPTRVHRPSEFHGHRASFTNPAPAQRFAICVFSTWPCAAVQPCHRRRIWNPDSPFLYSPALRRVGF